MRIVWLPEDKTGQQSRFCALRQNHRTRGSGCLSAKKIHKYASRAKILV
jgi:hypothetical protein